MSSLSPRSSEAHRSGHLQRQYRCHGCAPAYGTRAVRCKVRTGLISIMQQVQQSQTDPRWSSAVSRACSSLRKCIANGLQRRSVPRVQAALPQSLPWAHAEDLASCWMGQTQSQQAADSKSQTPISHELVGQLASDLQVAKAKCEGSTVSPGSTGHKGMPQRH